MFQVAINVEKGMYTWLTNENRAYVKLNGILGVPKVLWYGSEYGMNFLVMELLGSNMTQIQILNGDRPFTPKTTLLFAIQFITLLEEIHSRNILHDDIHMGNIMMGLGVNSNVVHLVDFGFAKFVDIATPTRSNASRKKDLIAAGEIFKKMIHGATSNGDSSNVPEQFSKFFIHCEEMQEHDIPYYGFLKKIFIESFEASGFSGSIIFDLYVEMSRRRQNF